MWLEENERIDDLEYKGLKIIQNKNEFCFGMDSILLSDFAKNIKKDSKVIDLGTGTGIIAILLSKKTSVKEIIGVEIQPQMARMAIKSVRLNELEKKVKILEEDIKNLEKIYSRGTFDAIVTNPPYKQIKTGLQNENIGKLISRHEIKCTLEDIIKTSNYLLKNNGEFYMVHRPNRIVDIFYLMRKYNIEPKLLKLVYPYINKEPNLMLIKGIKNAKPFLKIERPLFIYKEDGEYTEELLKIYNKKGE